MTSRGRAAPTPSARRPTSRRASPPRRVSPSSTAPRTRSTSCSPPPASPTTRARAAATPTAGPAPTTRPSTTARVGEGLRGGLQPDALPRRSRAGRDHRPLARRRRRLARRAVDPRVDAVVAYDNLRFSGRRRRRGHPADGAPTCPSAPATRDAARQHQARAGDLERLRADADAVHIGPGAGGEERGVHELLDRPEHRHDAGEHPRRQPLRVLADPRQHRSRPRYGQWRGEDLVAWYTPAGSTST